MHVRCRCWSRAGVDRIAEIQARRLEIMDEAFGASCVATDVLSFKLWRLSSECGPPHHQFGVTFS